jgi:hypothetical protein
MKQLKDLSITELKALVYDCNVERNKQSSNIEILEKELANRFQEPVIPESISGTPEIDQNTNKSGTDEKDVV